MKPITFIIILCFVLSFFVAIFFVSISRYQATERVIPAIYTGPDTTSERESFVISCVAAVDPSYEFKNREDIISLCHAVSVELYGVAGFMYVNRSGDQISRIKPCIKSATPEEFKVCGKRGTK